jgi:hypothetical protein
VLLNSIIDDTIPDIAKELSITSVLEKIQDYNRKRIQHVNRMPRNRLPRLIKEAAPQEGDENKEHH